MECYNLLDELEQMATDCTDEMQLKAALISLNILESDLIQLGLVENVVGDILSIRLKIQNRLGWFMSH
jgi:hypothetical protein